MFLNKDYFCEESINKINNTNIEYINIYGLFNRYDVKLPFQKEVNIYIGENGMGKTTILNCIYYILEKKFKRLAEIDFKSIEIKFKSEESNHNISIYDLNKYNKNIPEQRLYKIDKDLIDDVIWEYKKTHRYIDLYDLDGALLDEITRYLSQITGVPNYIAKRNILDYIREKDFYSDKKAKNGNPEKVKKLISAINDNVKEKIIYLPTYRRIEDDFSKLNISAEKIVGTDILIKFGMSDVQNSIDNILFKIRREAIEGFNKMTGILLKESYCNINNKTLNFQGKLKYRGLNKETVKIVLDRVGEAINQDDKKNIIELINNNEIYNEKYADLLNLIEKLVLNYEPQRKYDDRIKMFAETCNKYLNDKIMYYNPSELSLKIYMILDENKHKQIELTQLSSGEKQIVSLFSKLYLEIEEDCIVTIDEPELSLSIKWQSMLLPDIMRSGNCKLLLTVTHSPFIFENEFDFEAREMRNYIMPKLEN